ncbi:putative ATPase [Cryptotrichosporon argae]
MADAAPTTAPSTVPALSTGPTSASTSMPASPAADTAPDVADVAPASSTYTTGTPSDPEMTARATRLKYLLSKSEVYARIIGDRMARQQIEKAAAEQRAAVRRANKETKDKAAGGGRGGLRNEKERDDEGNEKDDAGKRRRRDGGGGGGKRVKTDEGAVKVEPEAEAEPNSAVADGAETEDAGAVKVEADEAQADAEDAAAAEEAKQYSFAQPALVTGAKLRDYQLAGVQWMISLYENGLNGILADEMGLGKTLQTISFLAHLRSKGTWGPFLIVCPLSVLNNWVTEFEKFTPTVPVLMYHGTPEHRAHLRATRMQAPAGSGVGNVRQGAAVRTSKASGRKSLPALGTGARAANTPQSFPIIITTYEICIKDRNFLNGFQWKFIVVDEGHRLKNLDCKLIRELKSYTSANRLILTGTPLHNNLAELWSLLNFILPDIFDDLDSFQQWFDLDDMSTSPSDDGLLNKGAIVSSLHAILKPFLLRRLKVDVEKELPPKKEYLLYAPLTAQQKDMYQAIVNGNIRQHLIDLRSGPAELEAEVEEDIDEAEGPVRATRKKERLNYKIEEDDRKWLKGLEKGIGIKKDKVAAAEDHGRDWQIKQATKSVNNMRLQNLVMQLRKISSHPFLFNWPADANGELVVNADLVNASGKMLLLNRLLDALFAKKHKVLLFSQFTTMLDVIEDWATVYKKWPVCRIDGTTTQESRRAQMDEFNKGDKCRLFLLSTRAGGLGINLVSADTVIFFDQDWNPQMDLQAQDRAHRIGQTKPVLIFRLVSARTFAAPFAHFLPVASAPMADTIETKILQKAGNKRRLEALVISQGKFGKVVDENGRVVLGRDKARASQTTADMARALLDLEGEEIDVAAAGDEIISDADLAILLDRSKEAFSREKGWSSALLGQNGKGGKKGKGEKTAFEVFVAEKDEAGDRLARMLEGEAEAEGEVQPEAAAAEHD